jgi:N-ethylmaleimide reductase
LRTVRNAHIRDTGEFDGVEPQYLDLVGELTTIGVAYVHLVDHSSMGAPAVPEAFKRELRQAFGGVFMASGGLDRVRAEAILARGDADLVAFGRPALANPDLVVRLRDNQAMNPPDFSTFYTPGPKGYTDYPLALIG